MSRKFFLTITTFSKVLALVVFITFPFYFFKLGLDYGKAIGYAEKSFSKSSLTDIPNSPSIKKSFENSQISSTKSFTGYIKTVTNDENGKFLDIDDTRFLSESSGECVSQNADNKDVPLCNPNGFFEVNENTQVSRYELTDSAVFDFSQFKETGLVWKNNTVLTNPILSLSELEEAFSTQGGDISWLRNVPYQIELDGGKIVKVTYIFMP